MTKLESPLVDAAGRAPFRGSLRTPAVGCSDNTLGRAHRRWKPTSTPTTPRSSKRRSDDKSDDTYCPSHVPTRRYDAHRA
jgi:hypothetical protein